MKKSQRKPNRLTQYNYNRNGAYFITICIQNKRCILSKIIKNNISTQNKLTTYGKIVDDIINIVPSRFNARIINYIIMPNHIHLLIFVNNPINPDWTIRELSLQQHSIISNIVGYIKMNSTKKIHTINPNEKIWQRSFHNHIIRNEKQYQKIWSYIEGNPFNWTDDCFYTKI